MTDVELVRSLIGNSTIADAVIQFNLQTSEEFIKAYCNLDTLPKALKSTQIQIAALKTAASAKGFGAGIQPVASVTDGEQSVSYAPVARQGVLEEDFVAAYGSTLNRYRKLPTVAPVKRPAGARYINDRTDL